MKEVILNDTTKIYVAKIENYNKELLLKEFKINFEFNSAISTTGKIVVSGKQSIIVIHSKEINNIKTQCIDLIETITNSNDAMCYNTNWIYINDKNTADIFFHNHIKNKQIPFLKNEWTYTFYLQMPNNLKDDEGYLLFKTDDGIIHKILPEEGNVIIFPADLLHTPTLAPNSTNERIVFGGAYTKLYTNVEYLKSKKSII
mgnify:CR=1 FL=1|jgi:hypothetical protein